VSGFIFVIVFFIFFYIFFCARLRLICVRAIALGVAARRLEGLQVSSWGQKVWRATLLVGFRAFGRRRVAGWLTD